MDEGPARLREDVVAVDELAGDMDAAAVLVLDVGTNQQLRVDRHRATEADEEPAGDGREPVPGRKQSARFVERRGDETAVDEPRRGLMPLVELEV